MNFQLDKIQRWVATAGINELLGDRRCLFYGVGDRVVYRPTLVQETEQREK